MFNGKSIQVDLKFFTKNAEMCRVPEFFLLKVYITLESWIFFSFFYVHVLPQELTSFASLRDVRSAGIRRPGCIYRCLTE